MSEKLNTNNRYTLYLNKCIELISTIVIKFDDVADAMNNLVITKLGLDSIDYSDKSTWKYYQNIAGIYHLTDTKMKIKSLDIDQEIDFTIENLKTNKNTKLAYTYDSRYYRELVSLYPDQELLIKGILYPVDINVAINSKDGTILNYPKDLIEDNEYSLINKLQKWIYNYLFRWVNKQFCLSDELYVATYIGQFYLHLVQALIAFRLENCKTNEAHSYHIQQYLASHGFLDSYLSVLTKEQALFFYRNIRYIERNAGKKDTFDWVTDKTMTLRNLPLYEITMNHNTGQL
jgi:hypothetical protein